MSKHTYKKHGIIVSYDNVYSIVGDPPDTVRGWYRAIVTLQGYDLDQINSVNYHLRTPAQQMIWIELGNGSWVIRPWWKDWLFREIGFQRKMWDVRTIAERPTEGIMFQRRMDALAFVGKIDEMLSGIRYPSKKP